MIYVAYLKAKILIYLTSKAQIASVIAEKVTILAKYLDFLNVFLKKLAVKLSKRFNINKQLINLELNK